MPYLPLVDVEEAAARQAANDTAETAQHQEEDDEDMERPAVYQYFNFLRPPWDTYYETQGWYNKGGQV